MSCTERRSDRVRELTLEGEVARFLATGESDPFECAVPGNNVFERITNHERRLREALLQEVQRREHGRSQKHLPDKFDPVNWTRRKIQPMVVGLFPRAEREVVLGVAERSIVFMTKEAAHEAIRETAFLSSARTIANIYLHSLGVPTLGTEPVQILGLNLEKECYVSMHYFTDEDPFADYVTHEVAHIFHNCKRETVGLPITRSKEWLLDIRFSKRETFAYACEAYGRMLEQGTGNEGRRLLLAQYALHSIPSNDQVVQRELLDILSEAIESRNGWKRILTRCSA